MFGQPYRNREFIGPRDTDRDDNDIHNIFLVEIKFDYVFIIQHLTTLTYAIFVIAEIEMLEHYE